MIEKFPNITVKQLEIFKDILGQCTDSFIYVMNVEEDSISISEQSTLMFDLPSKKFFHARETLERLVYKDDSGLFAQEMNYILASKKDTFSLEFRALNKNDKPIWLNMRGVLIDAGEEETRVLVGRIAVVDDIDRTDSLTNLPTGAQFRKDFALIKKRSPRLSGFMLRIGIDNMGAINEQFGIRTGDFVMSLVSDCIKTASKGIANAYKLNSDEFVCINIGGASISVAQKIYQSLKRAIAETEQKIDYDVVFTVSAGAVAFFNDEIQLDELMKKTNYALKEAKGKGRNNLSFFNAVEYTKHLRNLDLQEKLRESIKNGFEGFQLFYQPVVNAREIFLDSGKSVSNVIGAEALLRWSCPDYGTITPDEFIPILEKSGLIIPVGRWILLTGFNQCREWNKIQKGFHMSINLSYIQVKKSDVLTDVQMALDRSEVKPQNITLELTESGYMDNTQELQTLVENFRALGIKVDIDDFGTGYSNLRYLQYLHADTLKLDYSFVHKATGGDDGDRKVIKHITQMAHELGMQVCMEGVEDETDVAKLKAYEPDRFQGFYFGRPCTAVAFREHYLRPDSNLDVYKKPLAKV